MLSLMPRKGAGGRYRAGARALIVSLAFAALDLSPGPSPGRGGVPKSLHLSRSYCQAAPPSLAGKAGAPKAWGWSPSGGLGPAAADPDAALQRLAEETDRIKPSAPDGVARLRSVVRGLIDFERAQRREIAALRTGSGVRAATTVSRRRSRKKSGPAASEAPPAAGSPSPSAGAASASGTPATASATAASGALFAKRGLKKVHRAGCVFGERIKVEDRVYFKSMQEATAAGYEACKICRPDR